MKVHGINLSIHHIPESYALNKSNALGQQEAATTLWDASDLYDGILLLVFGFKSLKA